MADKTVAGDTLFAWQVQESDGRWSMVAAGFTADPDAVMPLIHRSREVIERMRGLAVKHARVTGQPLRLAVFELVGVEA